MKATLSLVACLSLALVLALSRPCASDQILFSFATFNPGDTSSFAPVNDAHIDNTSQSIYITTYGANNANNSVRTAALWYKEKVRGESFRTSFAMRMTNNSFVPSLGNRDGIAFVIQKSPQGTEAIGSGTGGIGYGDNDVAGGSGIPRSVAVEFDTYYDANLTDPSRNHYQVHSMGMLPNSANASAALNLARSEPFFNDNQRHYVEILYVPGTLTITVDGSLDPMTLQLNLDQLIGPLGPDGIYVGFTGSTRGVGETQEILSWTYVYLGNTNAANSVAYGAGMEASVAGEVAEFTIQAIDQFGYNITEGGDDFAVTISPTSAAPPAASVLVNVTDNADGTYSVSYTGTTATTYTVHATFNGSDIKGSPWITTIDPSAIDPAQCNASGSFTGGVAGTTLTIELQARDAYENKVGKQSPNAYFAARFSNGLETNFTSASGDGLYTTQYTIDQQGLYSIQVLFLNGSSTSVPIQGSPWTNCTIVPADPAAPECYALGDGLEMAIAGAPVNFTLVARDRFNNTLHEGLPSTFSFAATVTGGGATVPVTIEKGEPENGTVVYSGTYAVNTTGNYSLNIFLTPPDNTHIAGSPFLVSVFPSNFTWGPECVAYGAGLSGGDVGQTRSFVIQARDPFGNNMTESNATFTVLFTQQQQASGAAAMRAEQVAYNVTQDPADKGKFVVAYATTVAGYYSIDVSLNDKAIKGSPFKATVVPGALDPADCMAQGAGLSGQEKNKNMTFSISTFDLYGNALWKGGVLFIVNVTDRFNGYAGKGRVEDFGNGTYQVTYSVPQPGHYRLSVVTEGTHVRNSPWFFSIGGESMPETEKNLIIAGSVIGAVLLLAFVVGLVILYIRRRRSNYVVIG